jgi:hydrogenase maturation protease
MPRILVAGIGNVFLGDDGFGVEVATRLVSRPLPDGVKVADFGIRGVHLAYELLDGFQFLVMIDAVPLGDEPGTLAVLEPDLHEIEDGVASMDAHSMNPAVVLATLSRLGGRLSRVLVVGCQPARVDEGMGLSPRVAAAVEPAVELCCSVVADLCRTSGKESAA